MKTINSDIKELKEQRDVLVKQNQKEYSTRGNTQRCQEIFAQIEKIEKEIEVMQVSEYYNIPVRIAHARYDVMDKNEIKDIIVWWNNKHAGV